MPLASPLPPELIEPILASILAISSEAVLVTDADLRLVMVNTGAVNMFGWTAEELIGQPMDRLMPERFRGVHAVRARSFAEGSADSLRMSERAEVYGLRRNGEEFPAEASLGRIATPDGMLFTAIMRDISRRRAAEQAMAAAIERADAASQAKSAFLAAMSHEIRTPLNGVLGMAQAMAGGPLDPIQRERVDVIRDAGETLLALLNDLLDLSKIEAGRLELEEIVFDLEEAVNGACAAFRPLAQAKGLSLSIDLTQARGACRGDPTRLKQILQNLLSNAVKFTARGEVRLIAERQGPDVTFEVSDTGIGMEEAVLGRLFASFVQADTSVTRRFGGTGLGLSICRRLATLMGGSIEAASTPGRGSTFRLLLPLPKAVAEPPAASRPIARPEGGARVLAAEDNPTNQAVLRALLGQAGLEPVFVENGQEALDAWRGGGFDLILMDVQMPVMDGVTATRLIREEEAKAGEPGVPIVALTANAMPDQVAQYRQAGMDACVTKPISVAQLFETLARMLGQD